MKRLSRGYKPYSIRRLERKNRNKLVITLVIALIFGYFLLTWILPNLIRGLSVLNVFKPSFKKESIAEEVTLAPPVLNIPFEATNTATIKVKGYSVPNTQVELSVDDQLKTTAKVSDDGSFNATLSLELGINNVSGKTVDDKGGRSLPSKNIRIIYSNQKPKLELSSPTDDQTVQGGDKKVNVSGSTDIGNDILANEIKIIVDSEGNFSQSIAISEGENIITVVAKDKAGNTSTVGKRVIYKP